MIQTISQLMQVRSKCYRRGIETDVIRLTASFVRNLRHVELAQICLPVATTITANTRVVNHRDNHPGALSILDRGGNIGIQQIVAIVVAIDSVRNHESRRLSLFGQRFTRSLREK